MRKIKVISGIVLCSFSVASISAEFADAAGTRCEQARLVVDTTAIRDATLHLRQSFAERLGIGEVGRCSLMGKCTQRNSAYHRTYAEPRHRQTMQPAPAI
jgi:hypothetical protein